MANWNSDFINLFRAGFKHYISGDWKQSKSFFEEGLQIEKSDGPTKALLEFMSGY